MADTTVFVALGVIAFIALASLVMQVVMIIIYLQNLTKSKLTALVSSLMPAPISLDTLPSFLGQKSSNTNVAIGQGSGGTQKGSGIAIGHGAGAKDQDLFAIAIGDQAGGFEQEKASIALGFAANSGKQYGIAIGANAVVAETDPGLIAISLGDFTLSDYSKAGIFSQGGDDYLVVKINDVNYHIKLYSL